MSSRYSICQFISYVLYKTHNLAVLRTGRQQGICEKIAVYEPSPVQSEQHWRRTAARAAPAAPPAAAGASSPTFSPLYQQIKALITQSLQSGEWKPGELIPSEVELAGRYKVSQGTVRKAIDELAAENLVVRRQGKGTFVASHNEARAHFRFLQADARRGRAAPSRPRLPRSQAHPRAGRGGAPARPEVGRRGRLHQAPDVLRRRADHPRRAVAAGRSCSRA